MSARNFYQHVRELYDREVMLRFTTKSLTP